MKKFGRPPLPPEVVRDHRLVTYATESELDKLQQEALKRGLSTSTFCHDILMEYLKNLRMENS